MATTDATSKPKVLSPSVFAHVVLRTSNFKAMRDFYATFLGATPAFESPNFCLLSYDDEHHRVGIIEVPGLEPNNKHSNGFHHVAYTYSNLDDLATAYLQRKEHGILPIWPVNHGPTMSMYYRDPDGNQIEIQVDSFKTNEETNAYIMSEEFRTNPIGVDYDPEELVARLKSGESHESILKRPDIGPRGFEGVPIA